MKILIQTLLFFLLVTQICFVQWFWENPRPTGNDYFIISVINSNISIIEEYYQTIIPTVYGGAAWTKQASGTTEPLKAVYLKNESNG